jgi:hypothetical protein
MKPIGRLAGCEGFNSVKATGAYRLPPRPFFEVTIRDLKESHSSAVSSNMKSAGKCSTALAANEGDRLRNVIGGNCCRHVASMLGKSQA